MTAVYFYNNLGTFFMENDRNYKKESQEIAEYFIVIVNFFADICNY